MTDPKLSQRHGRPKVLVVDDNPTFRREMRGLLEMEKIHVVGEAVNGQEAVELAERLNPDVILMDQNMPVMSGVDATRQIKKRQPNRRVIFVAAEGSWRAEALKAGAEAYFVKDDDLERVIDAIADPLQPLRLRAQPEDLPTEQPRLRLAWQLALFVTGLVLLAALVAFPNVLLPGIALGFGLFFFIFGLRYYAANALILLATRGANGNGNGNGHGNGHRNGNGNGKGKMNGKGAGRGLSALGGGNGGNGIGRLHRQPFISIHLPIYNEKEVIDRLLTACTSLDYDNYEVIVADDSTDETREILRQRWGAHPRVKVSHRPDRRGFKGGALKGALERTDPRAEFVVVFDADFVPPPDILHQFLAYFYGTNGNGNGNGQETKADGGTAGHEVEELRLIDDQVAVVQGYQWHVLNASENWITMGIRSEFAGSYVVERSSQELLGALKMISGSVFMIRADVLREHGWGTSITEDWELTLRLYLNGYKVLYTPFIQAPAECVAGFKQLTRQRMRWAEGHTFNVKKFFLPLLRSENLTLREKLEFLYYAPYYLQSAFFILGTGSWFVSEIVLRHHLPFWTETLGWALVFANLFSLLLMNLTGLFLERGVRRNWTGLLSFILLSYLLVPYQAYAAIKGLLEPEEGSWHRTQKTGVITEVVDRLGLGKRMRRLRPKKKRPQSQLASRVASIVPAPIRNFSGRSSLGFRLASGLLTGIALLAILSNNIATVSAAPDTFYFHNTDTSGINPAGKAMNTTEGSTDSTLTFDTPSQTAYWYTDLTYPTGGDDATIAAGDYTLNMYFSQLPLLPADWYSADFDYRKKITLDAGLVAADQSDFPVVISLTDADLAKARSDGNDLLFTLSDGTTKLSHEIERFDSGTGELVAWVKVPSLSSSLDTDLYLYYGNANSIDQQNVADVWSNGFLEVWHLDETSGDHADSRNAYVGTPSGSITQDAVGQIDGADELLGPSTTTYVSLADGDLGNNAPFTISAWFNVDTATTWAGVVTKGRELDQDWVGLWANGTTFIFGWDWQGGKGGNVDDLTDSLVTGGTTWNYGVGTFDGTDRRLYHNAQLHGGPAAGFYNGITGSDTSIGNDLLSGVANSFDGFIDEVRIAGVARPSDWIQTEYDNQANPGVGVGKFIKTLAAEEAAPRVQVTVSVYHTKADGSSPQEIVTSDVSDVRANTANPYALAIGTDALGQTYKASDPQLLRTLLSVSTVYGGGSFDLAHDGTCATSQCSNLDTPVVTVPEVSVLFLASAIFVPMLTAALTRKRRLAVRLATGLASFVTALALLSQNVSVASASPDRYFLHPTATSGISPAGEYMNITSGTGNSAKVFDAVGDTYWYTDVAYPTGDEDATIAAGTYTHNMYFSALPTPQAPQVDAVRTGTTATNSMTISHPTSSLPERLMLVGVSINNDNFEQVNPDGITYNGNVLDFVGAVDHQGSGGDDSRVEIWKMVNPPTGTYDVEITFTADLLRYAVAGVITFTGVNQSDPLGTFASNYGDGTSASVAMPSATNELALGVFACETCTSMSIDSPSDQQWSVNAGSGNTFGAGGTRAGASPNVAVNATLGTSDHWAAGGISVKPAAPSVDIKVYLDHTKEDGSVPVEIRPATLQTITASTANPLALDLGSAAQQTFTKTNRQLLRLRIEVTALNNGGSFTLAYDGTPNPSETCPGDNCSSLDTPTVTVPEWGIAFLLLVPLIPMLMMAIWRRKRLAINLIVLMSLAIVQLNLLAARVDARALSDAPSKESSYTTPLTDSLASPAPIARYGPLDASGYRERLDLRQRSSTTRQQFKDGQATNRYVWEGSIAPMYYQDAEGEWREIDTDWQPSNGPWDVEMTHAEYNAFAMRRFDAGELIEYFDPASGQFVSFQPLPIQYTNDLGLTQAIADPQPVDAELTGNQLYWTGAFGRGLDLKWVAAAGRLDKRLIIRKPDALPRPSPIITAGGHPALRLQFLFRHSPEVGVWVNGEPWNEGSRTPLETSGYVEFRSRQDGRLLWKLNLPLSYDAQNDEGPLLGTFRFRSTGDGLIIEHLVPLESLRRASYPLEIDVTIDNEVSASVDDSFEYGNGGLATGDTALKCYSDTSTTSANYRGCGIRWTNVTVPKDAQIDVANLKLYAAELSGTVNHDIYFEANDNPVDFSTNPHILTDADPNNGRRRTAQSTSWVASTTIGTWYDSPSTAPAVQAIVNRAGWASGNAMVALMIPHTDATYSARFEAWDAPGGKRNNPILHIVYTNPPSNCQATYVSDTQIDVTWTDNSDNETGFKVESSVDGAGYSQIGTTGANATSYSDTTTLANKSYQYRVRATNSYGDSAYCTPTSVIYTSPSAPSNVTATHTANLEITVTWTDNSAYEDRFCVQRSKNGGAYGACVYVSASPYVDDTITQAEYDAKDSFTYRVRAEISSQNRVSAWVISNSVVVPERALLLAILAPFLPLAVRAGLLKAHRRRTARPDDRKRGRLPMPEGPCAEARNRSHPASVAPGVPQPDRTSDRKVEADAEEVPPSGLRRIAARCRKTWSASVMQPKDKGA